MVVVLTAAQVLERGLKLLGFDNARQQNVGIKTNIRRFRDGFGVDPFVVAKLFADLQVEVVSANIVRKPDVDHLLMMLHWLKSYCKESELSGRFGLNEKTLRGKLWTYIRGIQSLKAVKIKWIWDDPSVDQDTVFIFMVDGVHCQTYEERKNPTANVYSHKSGGPGLAYEIAIAIRHNQVVWVNGPFPAAVHDITMFRKRLKHKIPKGKRGIGDSGYTGEPNLIIGHVEVSSSGAAAGQRCSFVVCHFT